MSDLFFYMIHFSVQVMLAMLLHESAAWVT